VPPRIFKLEGTGFYIKEYALIDLEQYKESLRCALSRSKQKPARTRCPSDESLANYLSDTLTDEERNQIETHVVECSSCTDALVAVHTSVRATVEGVPQVLVARAMALVPFLTVSGSPGEEIVSRVTESSAARKTKDVVSLLAASDDPQEYTDMARSILDSEDRITPDFLRRLRELLVGTGNDHKRACLLQLLAELDDTEAIPLFVEEISRYAEKGSTPSLSLIAAVTYIGFLAITDDNILLLLKSIEVLTTNALQSDSPLKKALFAGIVATLGAIGRLEESTLLTRIMLRSDRDIVEGCLYNLSNIWTRADKQERVNEHYQICTGEALEQVISLYLPQINTSGRKVITPEHRIIAEALELLASVSPPRVMKQIPQVFMAALQMQTQYLFSAVTGVLRRISSEDVKEVLGQVSRHTQLQMDDVFVKLLHGGAEIRS